MRIFSRLFDRALHRSRHPHAERYLAVVSFTESSFFPVPPDVLLAPMTLARPQRGQRLAVLTTVTPVLHRVGYWGHFETAHDWCAGAAAPIEHHIRRYVDGIGWATLGILVVGYLTWSVLR